MIAHLLHQKEPEIRRHFEKTTSSDTESALVRLYPTIVSECDSVWIWSNTAINVLKHDKFKILLKLC